MSASFPWRRHKGKRLKIKNRNAMKKEINLMDYIKKVLSIITASKS